jgi:hypothetical protein
MTYTEQDVERIVVEVIRRLGGMPLTNTQSELTLDEHVVTMRSIEGKLAGVTRVVVTARAVVTPAVKDELNERNIELLRRAST